MPRFAHIFTLVLNSRVVRWGIFNFNLMACFDGILQTSARMTCLVTRNGLFFFFVDFLRRWDFGNQWHHQRRLVIGANLRFIVPFRRPYFIQT